MNHVQAHRAFLRLLDTIKAPFRHRNHDRCSIYAPCRAADLERSWQAFKRAVDDPATREAAIAADMLRRAQGREPSVSPFGGSSLPTGETPSS